MLQDEKMKRAQNTQNSAQKSRNEKVSDRPLDQKLSSKKRPKYTFFSKTLTSAND